MAVPESLAVISAAGGIAVGVMAGLGIGVSIGKSQRQPTRIVPVARKVDNRVVPGKFSREERRAHKRRVR